MMLPLAGVAELSVGATGVAETVTVPVVVVALLQLLAAACTVNVPVLPGWALVSVTDSAVVEAAGLKVGEPEPDQV